MWKLESFIKPKEYNYVAYLTILLLAQKAPD